MQPGQGNLYTWYKNRAITTKIVAGDPHPRLSIVEITCYELSCFKSAIELDGSVHREPNLPSLSTSAMISIILIAPFETCLVLSILLKMYTPPLPCVFRTVSPLSPHWQSIEPAFRVPFCLRKLRVCNSRLTRCVAGIRHGGKEVQSSTDGK